MLWRSSQLLNVRGLDGGHTEAYTLEKLVHQPSSFESFEGIERFKVY
jgi:hypothetical protein